MRVPPDPRWVAPIAALGYRGVGAERSITVCLLCQGTPVGFKASQPLPPRAIHHQSAINLNAVLNNNHVGISRYDHRRARTLFEKRDMTPVTPKNVKMVMFIHSAVVPLPMSQVLPDSLESAR